jgi:hypothetical protein
MFSDGKRRVTISIGFGFGFEVGYAIGIYLKLDLRSCPVLLLILKLSKQFTLLIITYLFSKSLHTVRIGFYLYLWNNLSYTGMY